VPGVWLARHEQSTSVRLQGRFKEAPLFQHFICLWFSV